MDGKPTAPARVAVVQRQKDSTLLRVVMHEGRKRQIREVAALLGHPVRELTRVRLGPLQLGTLETGQWRYLTEQEIRKLESIKRISHSRPQKRRRRPPMHRPSGRPRKRR